MPWRMIYLIKYHAINIMEEWTYSSTNSQPRHYMEVVSFTPRPLYPRGKSLLCPFDWRIGGPPSLRRILYMWNSICCYSLCCFGTCDVSVKLRPTVSIWIKLLLQYWLLLIWDKSIDRCVGGWMDIDNGWIGGRFDWLIDGWRIDWYVMDECLGC
jgi:hypothetical protein